MHGYLNAKNRPWWEDRALKEKRAQPHMSSIWVGSRSITVGQVTWAPQAMLKFLYASSWTIWNAPHIGEVMNLDDGTWYNCNDSMCRKQISADTNSTSAYVLFYMIQWTDPEFSTRAKLWSPIDKADWFNRLDSIHHTLKFKCNPRITFYKKILITLNNNELVKDLQIYNR